MRHHPIRKVLCLAVHTGLVLIASRQAFAYPEFQVYLQQNSGRNVNCALCHAHPDGPEGLKPGQIGSLKPNDLDMLNRARAAFEPGQDIQSPILNTFGNDIIERLGKNKFLQLRQDPKALADALGRESDLDGDGICDADEYLAGTLPLDPGHGDPARLFIINLRRYLWEIVLVGLATVLGLYGLHQIVRGFELAYRRNEGEDKTFGPGQT